MKRIDQLFTVHRACSDLFGEYESGDTAYVSNSSGTNGVVGFVEPRDGDAVFEFTGIVVNSFSRMPGSCGARVQAPPFIACGRSGNGLLVLEPKKAMTREQLAFYAAYLNYAHGWRFTWYRQATKTRLVGLMIPDAARKVTFPVAALLPERNDGTAQLPLLDFKPFALDTLFDLRAGSYHAESDLSPGKVPLVSCGDEENGVIALVDAPEEDQYRNHLTIALNGRPLTTKYHPYPFTTKDDVAVAVPRAPLRVTTLLFVQMMLNRERWRYSYYRKCFVEKLRRFTVALPHKNRLPDEDAMRAVLETATYWPFLKQRLTGDGG